MKRITALLLVIALFGGCASDCYAKTNWGFGPVVDWGFGPVDEVGDSNEFGLGIFAKQQDCPNGLCPLPYTTFEAGPPETVYRVPLPASDPFSYGWHRNEDGSWYEVVPQDGTPYTSVCPCCGNVKSYGNPTQYNSNCPTGQCPTPYSTRQVSRNYTAQWTFPGDIDSHLMGPPHYVSASQLAGMTYDQKLQLHDQQHNSGIGGGRIRTAWANRPRLFSGRIVQWFRARRGR